LSFLFVSVDGRQRPLHTPAGLGRIRPPRHRAPSALARHINDLRELGALASTLRLLPDHVGVDVASSDRRRMLRRALSRYLRTNAKACDTAEGIARWWMPPGIDVSETEVLPLLDELREKGLVARFSTLDGRWLYRRSSIDAQSDDELGRMTADTNGSS